MARRIVRWADRHATPLDRAAEALAPCLADARVVFLAESDHFVHETHVMRRAVLPYLVDRGARAVLEEISASDGRRIQRYLDGDDPRCLDRVATFGDASVLRADRDDRLGGLLAASSYPFAGMRFEHQRTHDSVARRGIRFFGLDLDATPGAIYEDIPGLSRIPGETRPDEMARLEQVAARCAAHAEALGAHIDGLRFVEATHVCRDWAGLSAAMAVREDGLHRRAESALAECPDAVVLGHAGHLARDPSSIRAFDVLAGPPSRTLGSRIAQHHPVAAIWMLYGEGTTAHAWAGSPRAHALRRGTLNALLAPVGESFVLPIRGTEGERLLAAPMSATWSSGGRFEARLARQADALVFFRSVTPLHVV